MSSSSASTASHCWLLSSNTTLHKTTQALSRAFFVTAPNTRSTPLANEIITYDFLQQYVEANGGGNGVEMVQLSQSNRTLPSGGTWYVIDFSYRINDDNGSFNGMSVYLHTYPGGTSFQYSFFDGSDYIAIRQS